MNKKWIMFRIVLTVCLVLTFVGLAGPVAPVQGAQYNIINVTTTEDELNNDDDCSLREAIQTANTDSDVDACETGVGIDRIQLPAGIYTLDLVGASEDANTTGDLDILDGGDLVIQGDGAGVTIIDGNNSDRVFHVCPGGGCTNTVTFSGVTIQNGNEDLGGGIYNAAGTTTVDGSFVISNKATDDGGGIYNEATLNVQNGSTIGEIGAANTASDDGGGIYNAAGTTTVDARAVISNTAGVGGGIFNAAGTTTVDGSTVSANTATNGGGIYNDATLDVQNGSTIGGAGAGNQAIGADVSDGGGIYNAPHATATVDDSAIISNTALDSGGGIINWWGTITVDGSIVSGNTASIRGGGIYNCWGGTLTVTNSTIGAGNTADDGGGIYNQSSSGTTTVDGSTVSANTGGGIYNNDGTVTVNNSTISANAGSGIVNHWTEALLTVTNSTIADNQTSGSGGGIYNYHGAVIVDGSTISANTAYNGGGIFNWGGTRELTVTNSIIGGVGAGNTAYSDGGGIYCRHGTTIIDATTVSHNTADKMGGGIYLQYWKLIVQNGSTIGGNTANILGGGIFNEEGTAVVTGSRILYNTATTGGGVYNWENTAGATSVTGSCILGNSDTSFYNQESAEQIATGNWWGAASGPSGVGPGAGDSVSANVDYSGFLTAPILGCTPDLQVNKANDAGGNGRVGTPFTWTLTISNTSFISATFAAGATILMDDLPAGPTYGAPVPGNFVNVANSVNVQCGIAGSTLTCDAAGGDVTIGGAGSFDVTFSVTPAASGTLTNPRSDGDCKVDPDGHVGESDDDNNECPVNSVNVTDPGITVSKQANVSSALVGETLTYTYWVTNTGDTVLDSIVADDDRLGTVTLGATSLAPGAGTSGILAYTVVAGDLPGPLTTIVTVTASPPAGPLVTATAGASVALASEYRIYLPLIASNHE